MTISAPLYCLVSAVRMPRSLAERVDRASLSRHSLGRFSVGTEVSVSSAATRHWEHSVWQHPSCQSVTPVVLQVSDIYGQDEIEALLLDLNKLEFAKFDTDFDTFDIDGSRIEGLDEVGDTGPKSPLVARPTSPGGLSSRSWNSHTHYQQFKEPPDDYGWGGSRGPGHIIRPLQAAVCYCDISVLKTPRTLLRVLVLVSMRLAEWCVTVRVQITSVSCLWCLLTAGSALPHAPNLRFILFVSLASALFSLLVIVLNISHLHALLPMDYAKMVASPDDCTEDPDRVYVSAKQSLLVTDSRSPGLLLARGLGPHLGLLLAAVTHQSPPPHRHGKTGGCAH